MRKRAKAETEVQGSGSLREAFLGAGLMGEAFPQLKHPVFKLIDSVITTKNMREYLAEIEEQRKAASAKAREPKPAPIEMTKEEYLEAWSTIWDRSDERRLEHMKFEARFWLEYGTKRNKADQQTVNE
jgi:hypothetical protein